MKSQKVQSFSQLFNKYPLLVEKLEENGFKTPTPIQHKAFDYALSTQDLLIQAPTGSGKTLIYGIKMIIEHEESPKISKSQNPSNLKLKYIILAPNTLLVEQIHSMITKIIPNESTFSITTLKKNIQEKSFNIITQNTTCLVTTPKILAQQLQENSDELTQIVSLILDEADMLLTKEHLEGLEQIIESLPEQRQDLLFSATYTKEMGQIAKEYLHNPKVIELPSLVEKSQISQLIYIIESNLKLSLLHHTLKNLQFGLLLIFVNRKEHIRQVEAVVKELGFDYRSVSSTTSEFERNKSINDFKEMKFDVLIATDLLSRGVDVPQISHIINYSIPQDHTKYVHRIGRATRHTNKGTTINFISKEDVEKFKQVLQEYKIEYKMKQTPQLENLPKSILKRIEGKIQHKKKR
ncbi:MAG: DEAD/DEAH box helicase [Nanoarchaeota archaeon]|nr:DEAD/DEAH box helicase [Nanoarchaeota archaeon]